MSTSLGLSDNPAILPAFSKTRKAFTPRVWLHASLFLVTLFTTTMMGARYMYNFHLGRPPIVGAQDIFPFHWAISHLDLLGSGLSFSLTLLGILLAHEFGHYYFCRRHDVEASLPYLLPAPTLSGTAGAVIYLHSRVRSRAALLSIGSAGPICGFLVCIPTTLMGIALSKPQPVQVVPSLVRFHAPLFMDMCHSLLQTMYPAMPALTGIVPHPMLVASWVGLFITSLNLIPAGQLDGGHILYAAAPELHRRVTATVIFLLILGGAIYWIGWLLWAMLLMLPGMHHPSVAVEPAPTAAHRVAIVIALGLFILTMLPQPFTDMSLIQIAQSAHW
ncbi:MAG: site-2 protease family protein [Acidobacteriaceae bacterium]